MDLVQQVRVVFTWTVSAVFSWIKLLIWSVLCSVWIAISEEIASSRLAAIRRAAACTPASIERNRFSNMYG